ncbi:MAG: ATP-binding protein, partial [Campylobacterales bacterium]
IKFTTQGFVEIALLRQKDKILLEVRDSGCGIDPVHLKIIFEPFGASATGSTGERGSGLGMAIVYQMCQAMQIGISISSHVGQGTTVALEFQSIDS